MSPRIDLPKNGKKERKEILLDLTQLEEQRQLSHVGDFCLKAKKKLFETKLDFDVNISVTLLKTKSLQYLERNPKLQFLQIKKGNVSNQLIKFRMKKELEDFEIKLQTAAILDYKKNQVYDQNNKLEIGYRISYWLEGEKEKKHIDDCFVIRFAKISPEPVVTSMSDGPIMYRNEERVNGFSLSFSNSVPLMRAPILNMKIRSIYLEKDNHRYDDVVSICREEAKPSMEYNSDGAPVPINVTASVYMSEENEILNLYGQYGYSVNVPLRFNLSKLTNPVGELDNYSIKLDYEYWYEDRNAVTRKSDSVDLFISKNKILTALCADYCTVMADGTMANVAKLKDSEVSEISDITLLNGETDGGLYRIRFYNQATVVQQENAKAAVRIRNIRYSRLSLMNGAFCFDAKGKKVDVDSFCKCIPSWSSDGNVDLFPAMDLQYDISFDLMHESRKIACFIDGQKNILYDVKAQVTVEFEYLEDSEGSSVGQYKRYKCSLLFPLSIAPAPEWLGLDFGTSAVVALYGVSKNDQGRPNDCIIDLAAAKLKGLRQAYGANDARAKVTDETYRFINSNIVVNDDTGKNLDEVGSFKEYTSGKILFSPGNQIRYDYLLPSLKSMMGYSRLPIVKRNDLTEVDDVYEMAYRQLFSLYLASQSHGRPIEKIVMTYPNTFAPEHVQKLRDMAKTCIPSLRNDWMVCISESDAVAFRYITRRRELLATLGDKNINDSNVLIYDMGAGTLDITYFGNSLDEKNRRVVEFKGKMGLNKAGNYIDYKIAEIIVELCYEKNITDSNGESFDKYINLKDGGGTDIKDRSRFKEYVKNKVKPLLADNITETKQTVAKTYSVDVELDDIKVEADEGTHLPKCSGFDGFEQLTVEEILNHEKFNNMLESISDDVFKKCCALFGSGGELPLDVIVFSGRMTSMKLIRDYVTRTAKRYNPEVHSLEISGINDDANELKTAVVNGALAFAEGYWRRGGVIASNMIIKRQRSFYALYYLMLHYNTDEYVPVCVVDGSKAPYNKYKDVDLSIVNEMYLVQTYVASEKDMTKDFEECDYSTILARISCQNYSNVQRLGVCVDDKTLEVYMTIGGQRIRRYSHDNINSTAFKKSAWPILLNV